MVRVSLGFHFRPKARELIEYLKIKARGGSLPSNNVVEKNLYGDGATPWEIFSDDDLWELLDDFDNPKMLIHVFTKLSSKSPKRINRTAGCGTWSGQTKGKDVLNVLGEQIGINKMLTFETKNDSEELKEKFGHWTMHEYTLSETSLKEIGIKSTDYVVCKITWSGSRKMGSCGLLGKRKRESGEEISDSIVDDVSNAVQPSAWLQPDDHALLFSTTTFQEGQISEHYVAAPNAENFADQCEQNNQLPNYITSTSEWLQPDDPALLFSTTTFQEGQIREHYVAAPNAENFSDQCGQNNQLPNNYITSTSEWLQPDDPALLFSTTTFQEGQIREHYVAAPNAENFSDQCGQNNQLPNNYITSTSEWLQPDDPALPFSTTTFQEGQISEHYVAAPNAESFSGQCEQNNQLPNYITSTSEWLQPEDPALLFSTTMFQERQISEYYIAAPNAENFSDQCEQNNQLQNYITSTSEWLQPDDRALPFSTTTSQEGQISEHYVAARNAETSADRCEQNNQLPVLYITSPSEWLQPDDHALLSTTTFQEGQISVHSVAVPNAENSAQHEEPSETSPVFDIGFLNEEREDIIPNAFSEFDSSFCESTNPAIFGDGAYFV